MAEWIGDVIIEVDKIRNIVFKVPSGKEYCIDPLDFFYAIKYAVKKSGGKVVKRKNEVEE